MEQSDAGSGHPPAALGGGIAGRNRPCRFEATEMIDAYDIDHAQGAAQALDPPIVAALGQHVPAIVRVAPELAGCTEVVRWHTGDDQRIALPVELEQIGMCPGISAIVGHKDW